MNLLLSFHFRRFYLYENVFYLGCTSFGLFISLAHFLQLIGHFVIELIAIKNIISFQIINGKYVEGFYIYARQLDSDNDTYKMLTVLNGGGASTCTVNGLMKYQSYEFFIVPFYKTVEGKPSNSRVARTLEDGEFGFYFLLFFLFRLFVGKTFTR